MLGLRLDGRVSFAVCACRRSEGMDEWVWACRMHQEKLAEFYLKPVRKIRERDKRIMLCTYALLGQWGKTRDSNLESSTREGLSTGGRCSS